MEYFLIINLDYIVFRSGNSRYEGYCSSVIIDENCLSSTHNKKSTKNNPTP